MSHNDSSARVGQTIAGKFVIDAVLAVGGTGTVYRARHLGLDRMVALKLLREEFARDEDFIERFKREARAASRLEHPNSVRVLDFGQHDGSLLYLAMEYVEGRTLFEVIKADAPLPEARIVDILSQVLAAVGVAHDMGVVHRDLKPENIMIMRGTSDEGEHAELVKVLDFGIAALGTVARGAGGDEAEGPRMTKRGLLVGTPEYMAPEQAGGERADRRSDLYSAGVVLYQMMTGRLPFRGDNALTVAVKHITEAPTPPSSFAVVNLKLEAVCIRAMSKAPDERFASAREMRSALRAAINLGPGRSSAPRSVITGGEIQAAPGGEWSRRPHTPLIVGLSLATLFAAALGARTLVRSRRAPPAAAVSTLEPAARAPTGPSTTPTPTQTPTPAGAETAAPENPPEARTAEANPPETRPPAPATSRRSRTALAREARQRAKHATRLASASERAGARKTGRIATGGTSAATASHATAPPTSSAVAGGTAGAAPKGATATNAAVAPPPAPQPPLDLNRASVSIAAISSTSAIPSSNIRAALSRAPMVHCYREALRAAGRSAGGTAVLHMKIDIAGYVTSANLEGAQFLPGVKACVEKAARGARVKDVDTGEATADITLNFTCTP
jgi:serine/threonine-protein kinase